MRFGYTIIYVPDVTAAVVFYEAAFGLERRFLDESGMYAELETGAVSLAFAHESMAAANGFAIEPARLMGKASPVELAFVSETPEEAFAHAIKHGASAVKSVEEKPWGQKVGHLRDLNGIVVEICSPMA